MRKIGVAEEKCPVWSQCGRGSRVTQGECPGPLSSRVQKPEVPGKRGCMRSCTGHISSVQLKQILSRTKIFSWNIITIQIMKFLNPILKCFPKPNFTHPNNVQEFRSEDCLTYCEILVPFIIHFANISLFLLMVIFIHYSYYGNSSKYFYAKLWKN